MLVELMALHLSKVIAVMVQISLKPAQVPKPAKERQPENVFNHLMIEGLLNFELTF